MSQTMWQDPAVSNKQTLLNVYTEIWVKKGQNYAEEENILWLHSIYCKSFPVLEGTATK